LLLIAFDIFLLLNIYLVELRKRLTQKTESIEQKTLQDLISKLRDATSEIITAGWMTIAGGCILFLQLIIFGMSPTASFKMSSTTITITPFQIILLGGFISLFGYLLNLPQKIVYAKNRISNIKDFLVYLSSKNDLFSVNHLLDLRERLKTKDKQRAEDIIAKLTEKESEIFTRKIRNLVIYIVEAKVEIIIAGITTFVAGMITWIQLVISGSPLAAVIQTSFGAFTITPFQIIILGISLLIVINLLEFIRRLTSLLVKQKTETKRLQAILFTVVTGGIAGLLAGLFGIGGGVILVPLQLLLLNAPVKIAIQTSLGVIVITSISACFGHAMGGNLLLIDGGLIGIGGLVGAQISTRFLPRMSEQFVNISFRSLLASLFVYTAFLAVMTVDS
jgi:hypothetical protein